MNHEPFVGIFVFHDNADVDRLGPVMKMYLRHAVEVCIDEEIGKAFMIRENFGDYVKPLVSFLLDSHIMFNFTWLSEDEWEEGNKPLPEKGRKS